MNRRLKLSGLLLVLLSTFPVSSRAGFLDDLLSVLGRSDTPVESLDDATIVRGLKEAVSTGTKRAVAAVSRQDGYFGNEMIRIAMPEKLGTAAELIGKFGFRQEVDDFILGMNRAAEKAAPRATDHFVSALKTMSFDDARNILHGDKTSATEYFRQKTGKDIHAAFKPIVSASLQEVGAARSYMRMMERFNSIPFAGKLAAFDLEEYVTGKAVDGLFTMLGEEEKKIRTDPAARGTELLRKVFGK